jgi:hypothetical protein
VVAAIIVSLRLPGMRNYGGGRLGTRSRGRRGKGRVEDGEQTS